MYQTSGTQTRKETVKRCRFGSSEIGGEMGTLIISELLGGPPCRKSGFFGGKGAAGRVKDSLETRPFFCGRRK